MFEPFLKIYDEEAKPVRIISLPKDFIRSFSAIEKTTGEYVVSHWLASEWSSLFLSTFSADGHVISKLSFKDVGCVSLVKLFLDTDSNILIVVQTCIGNIIYQLDQESRYHKLNARCCVKPLTELYYDREKRQLILAFSKSVHTLTLSKN